MKRGRQALDDKIDLSRLGRRVDHRALQRVGRLIATEHRGDDVLAGRQSCEHVVIPADGLSQRCLFNQLTICGQQLDRHPGQRAAAFGRRHVAADGV